MLREMIYDNIDNLLHERGINRKQLAQMAGIPYSTLASAFSRKQKNFPIKYAKPIAQVLGVDIEVLYGHPLGVSPTMFPESIQDIIDEWIESKVTDNKRVERLLSLFNQLGEEDQMQILVLTASLVEIKHCRRVERQKTSM